MFAANAGEVVDLSGASALEVEGNKYYFDETYGMMAKGHVTIEGQSYYLMRIQESYNGIRRS